MNSCITFLVSAARVTMSKELFLLITASLANISFLESQSFIQSETCHILMTSVRHRSSFHGDLQLKDQVITILANIASFHPLEIVSSGGLVFLLSCLELRPAAVAARASSSSLSSPSSSHSPPSPSCSPPSGSVGHSTGDPSLAIERMQQKIAAALARLASNTSCASLLLRLNGVRRIIDLCRSPSERNHSDTVLLACLAG